MVWYRKLEVQSLENNTTTGMAKAVADVNGENTGS